MDRTTFEARLRLAVRRAIKFAAEHVRERLPEEATLRVYPNRSFDGNPRVGDEEVFPRDSLPAEAFHGPWSVDEALEFLWREGKVPEWIDIAVADVDARSTVVSLRCCGRFTSREDLMYHRNGGLAPFSVKSPILPPGWEDVETSGKFALRWMDSPLLPLKRTWSRLRRSIFGRNDREAKP
ncbi:MAG: hypothetical protein BGO49_06540 [Planctomycetales bacterium 71-10]|nr:MAG: hypothetical protein BGO49_06540 [Planctomycetales bacterium 71-10]